MNFRKQKQLSPKSSFLLFVGFHFTTAGTGLHVTQCQAGAGGGCEAVIFDCTYVRSAVRRGDFHFPSLVTFIRFLALVAQNAVKFSLKVKIQFFK